MAEHGHILNKGLVRSLFAAYRAGGIAPVRIRDLDLDHNQMANFQKLQHWGLAEMAADKAGNHRRGYWRVTHAGAEFLTFGRTVPRKVWTFRGKVTEMDHSQQISPLNVWDGYRLPEAWAKALRGCRAGQDGQLGLFIRDAIKDED